MAYLTAAQLEDALGADLYLRLLDDDNNGTADTDPLAQVLARVEGRVNGYASRVYTAAALTASVPEPLYDIALALGKHFSFLRKSEFLNEKGETPVQGEYNEAMRLLREIGERKFRLDVNGAPEAPANAKATARTGTYQNAVAVGEGFIKDGTGPGGF